ncbi:MAG: YkgJ family cysteine cluster protein [Lentisphaeria bacterium]|nr:YkgJ family cysteine cluster protein [Lentisphaeria bacterium]
MTAFSCRRCGACCRWPGCVKVTGEEADRIASFLGISPPEFIDRFTRLSPDRLHLSLLEKDDGACQWLSDAVPAACLIEPVKPRQCRDFPSKWNFPGWQKLCGGTFEETDGS